MDFITLGVARPCLHVPNNGRAVFIVDPTIVEFAREAVQAVTGAVHVGPSHSKREVGVGKGAMDHATLEARFVGAGALAVAAKTSDGVKDWRVGHVLARRRPLWRVQESKAAA